MLTTPDGIHFNITIGDDGYTIYIYKNEKDDNPSVVGGFDSIREVLAYLGEARLPCKRSQ